MAGARDGRPRPGPAARRDRKVLYLLPLVFPVSLWVLASVTLFYYGAKLFIFQARIASILLPVLIAAFSVMTIHFVVVARRKLRGTTRVKRPTRVAQVTFTAFIILFNATFVYLIAPHLAAIRFASGPSLTWGTGQDPATSISIVWKTADPVDTRVFLGTDPGAVMLNFENIGHHSWLVHVLRS